MPARTVTLQVNAVTAEANRQLLATGAYFEKLRQANPVELKIKIDRAQAIAESKIIAAEMATTVRDTIKLSADRGGTGNWFSRAGAGIGSWFTNIGAGLAPLAGAGGAGAAATGVGLLATPGGAAAGLAALPFLAQQAASLITFGLGGALVGLGVLAEKGTAPVKTQFAGLQKVVTQTFTGLSPAFGAALHDILSGARTFIPQFIQAFKPALDAIAGPLASFAVMIEGTLAKPEVADALKAVGQAFGGILKALTPAIPGIVTAIADGITNIARAVSANPKAFADFVTGLGHLAGIALDVIGWLTQVAVFEEKFVARLSELGSAIAMPFRLATALSISAPKEFMHFGDIVIGVGRKIVLAFDIVKESVRITLDQLEIIALNVALGITTAFGHLPGPLGAPFRQASAAIRKELVGIQGDVGNAVNNISADWARLNGRSANLYVYTNFVNVGSPPTTGGIFPTPTGRPPGTNRVGYAGGTAFAAPGWAWVGERGPELVRFGGGETVLPGYAGGAGIGGRNAQIDDLINAVDNVAAMVGALTGVTAQAPVVAGAAMGLGSRAAAYGALYP